MGLFTISFDYPIWTKVQDIFDLPKSNTTVLCSESKYCRCQKFIFLQKLPVVRHGTNFTAFLIYLLLIKSIWGARVATKVGFTEKTQIFKALKFFTEQSRLPVVVIFLCFAQHLIANKTWQASAKLVWHIRLCNSTHCWFYAFGANYTVSSLRVLYRKRR